MLCIAHGTDHDGRAKSEGQTRRRREFFLSFLSFILSFFTIIVILLLRESNVNVLYRGGVRVIHALAQFHEADNLDRGAIANIII